MSDRWGNNGNSDRVFSWAPKSLQMVTLAMKLNLLLGRKAMTNLYYSVLKSRDITDKGPSSQSYGFSSSCTDVRDGPLRRLRTEEMMLLNCGAGEDS